MIAAAAVERDATRIQPYATPVPVNDSQTASCGIRVGLNDAEAASFGVFSYNCLLVFD